MVRFRDLKDKLALYVKLAQGLAEDPRVPRVSKILLAMAAGYFFLPFDLIPDFIPVIGHLDDALIVPGLLFLALQFIPREVFHAHHRKVFGRRG